MPYFIIHIPFLHVAGMAIFPFIFVSKKHYLDDEILINHEKIHLRQQLETLIVPFYVLYISNYVFNLFKYRNHDEAYMNLYFEREAFWNESDLDYLKNRRFWAFLGYLRK